MLNLLLAVIYLSFISLGLPDSVLGAAWPTMRADLDVPLSYAGIISMIIAFGTVVSSLQTDRLTLKFGTGKIMVFSVALTALALFGFSMSGAFWMLCLWAIPYGLGAGCVDASLNNYVALHYASRHMSWLHCMWGVGASVGPYILGYALLHGEGWEQGYFYIALLQIGLTLMLLLSLPLWKPRPTVHIESHATSAPLNLRRIVGIPGTKEVMLTFFCYCSVEGTTGLWASSYLALHEGVSAETAATLGSLFFIGITVGRGLSGFLTFKLNNVQMVRLGICLILLGIVALWLPLGSYGALAGFILIGLGCAPIYPCLIHSTPQHFGVDKSQAIIGVQMASAYVGTCLMPPLFGLIANHIDISLLPFFMLILSFIMAVSHGRLLQKTQ